MRAWLRRLRCGLFGGHLPVTKSGAGLRYEECFICGTSLGRGWDVRDLALTLPEPVQPKAVAKARPISGWKRRAS